MSLLNGLILYYNFDEVSGTNCLDLTGNSNGDLSNVALRTRESKFGNGIDFGNGSYNFDTNYSFDESSAFSISFWADLTNASNKCLIGTLSSSLGSTGFGFIHDTSNNWCFKVSFGGGTFTPAGNFVSASGMNHYIITYDGSNLKCYENNVLKINASVTIINGTNNLFVGSYINNTSYDDSVFDELAVWTREITSAERSELYNNSGGSSYPFRFEEYSVFDDCVAYFSFKDLIYYDIYNFSSSGGVGANADNHLGQSNRAKYFTDGSGTAYTIVTNESDYDFLTDSSNVYSVCFWAKGANSGSSSRYILYKGYSGEYDLRIDSNQIYSYWNDGSNTRSIYNSDAGFFDDNWAFYTFVNNGASSKIYKNGVSKSVTISGSSSVSANNNDALLLGQERSSTSYDLTLGVVMLFNNALSDDKVKQLYDLTKNKVIYPIVRGGRE